MAMQNGIDHERQAQLDAWRDQAVRDGVARVAILAYAGSWRRQTFPRAGFSAEPFAMAVATIVTAYPERNRHDNAAVALELLDWTRRRHGPWFANALRRREKSGGEVYSSC